MLHGETQFLSTMLQILFSPPSKSGSEKGFNEYNYNADNKKKGFHEYNNNQNDNNNNNAITDGCVAPLTMLLTIVIMYDKILSF